MKEHGLSETEVVFSEISTSESKSSPSNAEKLPEYMAILAMTIEKAFAVKCLVSWRLTASHHYKRVVKFYGLDGRDVAAAYIFDVLTRQIKQARKQFQNDHCGRYMPKHKAKLADEFCKGWASGAYHAVKKMAISEEQELKMSSYAKKIADDGVGEAKSRRSSGDDNSYAAYMGYRKVQRRRFITGWMVHLIRRK